MNVYSFYRKHSFREVRSVSTHTQQLDLIEMWKDSWSKYGWNPIVLGMDDIIKDDFFWKYYNIVSKLPVYYQPYFEISAWLREFSINQVSSRNNDSLFCVSDYDVINYGIRPDMFPNEPCYYEHITLYPSIQSQETMNAWINLIIDKYSGPERKKYLHEQIFSDNRIAFVVTNTIFGNKLRDYNELPIKLDISKDIFYQKMGFKNYYLEKDMWKDGIDLNKNIRDWKPLKLKNIQKDVINHFKNTNLVHLQDIINTLYNVIFEKIYDKFVQIS